MENLFNYFFATGHMSRKEDFEFKGYVAFEKPNSKWYNACGLITAWTGKIYQTPILEFLRSEEDGTPIPEKFGSETFRIFKTEVEMANAILVENGAVLASITKETLRVKTEKPGLFIGRNGVNIKFLQLLLGRSIVIEN